MLSDVEIKCKIRSFEQSWIKILNERVNGDG